MKDYRQFLNENLLTEDLTSKNQFYTEFISWLVENGYIQKTEENLSTYYVEKSFSDTAKLNILVYAKESSDRAEMKLAIQEFLESYGKTQPPFSWENRSTGDSLNSFFIEEDKTGLNRPIQIYFKYVSKSITVQEVLTAALVLIGNPYPEGNIMDFKTADGILKAASDKVVDVIGTNTAKGNKVDEIKKALVMNYVDLAPSISASNSILGKIEGTPSKAYWTGQMWAPEIQFLNPPSKDSGFKNYNSSDVIFKVGKNFWGFSLKKKETPSSVNPTLLNKPASGKDSLLNGILDDKDLKIINDARINFFKNILEKIGIKNINKMSDRKLFQEVGKLNDEQKENITRTIKSEANEYFKILANKVPANPQKFMEVFFEKAFKFKLKSLIPKKLDAEGLVDKIESSDFQFYLTTGIGKQVSKGVKIDPATSYELDNTATILGGLLQEKKLSISLEEGKLQAFDIKDGDGPAKVFFVISYDDGKSKTPIVKIEIRYKGSYTPHPQFQAYTTKEFSNLFK